MLTPLLSFRLFLPMLVFVCRLVSRTRIQKQTHYHGAIVELLLGQVRLRRRCGAMMLYLPRAVTAAALRFGRDEAAADLAEAQRQELDARNPANELSDVLLI